MLKTEVKIKNFPHKMSIKSKLNCVCCKKMGLKSEKSSILGWVCGIQKKPCTGGKVSGDKMSGVKCFLVSNKCFAKRVLIHDSSKYVRVLRIDR